MPRYFIDTSALAKAYHREAGSDHIDRILDERGSQSLISRLSLVELESVFAIKLRTREIDEHTIEIARRWLRADLVQKRIMIGPPVETHHFRRARSLIQQFGATEGLRTLDAIQLAVALDLRQAGRVGVVVSADRRLTRVAGLTGFAIVNPEDPGSLVI